MHPDRIARLLPALYQEARAPGSALDALLHAMAAMHAPAEAVLAELDRPFDPRRAEDGFVALVAGWVALDPYLAEEGWEAEGQRGRAALDPERLRDLAARAARLARARGTEAALVEALELATGLRGFRLETGPPGPDGRPRPFHARLAAPPGARAQAALVELVVRTEKPAFVTLELAWAPGEA